MSSFLLPWKLSWSVCRVEAERRQWKRFWKACGEYIFDISLQSSTKLKLVRGMKTVETKVIVMAF